MPSRVLTPSRLKPAPTPHQLRRLQNDHFHLRVVTHVDCSAFDAIEGWSFACECSDGGCRASIELTLAEFRMVRAAGPTHVAIAPDHVVASGFEVIARHNRFAVAKELT